MSDTEQKQTGEQKPWKMDMCWKPSVPPRRIKVPGQGTCMWRSNEDGRIFVECEKCKGAVCMRGPLSSRL